MHVYRPTVPGLEATTTGREPSALPNLTDELYTDKWRTKFKPLIGYRIGTPNLQLLVISSDLGLYDSNWTFKGQDS